MSSTFPCHQGLPRRHWHCHYHLQSDIKEVTSKCVDNAKLAGFVYGLPPSPPPPTRADVPLPPPRPRASPPLRVLHDAPLSCPACPAAAKDVVQGRLTGERCKMKEKAQYFGFKTSTFHVFISTFLSSCFNNSGLRFNVCFLLFQQFLSPV